MVNLASGSTTDPTLAGTLPQRLHVLYVPGPKSPRNWLHEALATERLCQVSLTETPCLTLALEKLREETYDAVLVDADADTRDCQSLIDAIRAGSHDHQAVIILGEEPNSALATHCYESGADGFVAVQTSIPRELLWQIARAAERGQLRAENFQLRQRQQRQKAIEADEILKLASEQESILRLASPVNDTESGNGDNAPWLEGELRELIQAYVIMGSGNLMQEVQRFLDRVQQMKVSRHSVMVKYSSVLRNVLEELGTRSSRHVYNRANLLLLDLLLKLSHAKSFTLVDHGNPIATPRPSNTTDSKECA